jgi:hypothetical protein
LRAWNPWKFSGTSYFTDSERTRGAKKIPKIFLKTRFKTKETLFKLEIFKNQVSKKYIKTRSALVS